MRLIRFGENGKERPGILKDDNIIDLKEIYPDIPDICESFFREGWFEKVKNVKNIGKKMNVHIACPINKPSKIICLGKNYLEHAKEGGFDVSKSPLIFCKAGSALSGPFDPIIMPHTSSQIDWEVELAFIISKEGKRIKKEEVFNYIAGFCIMNDVSARDVQFADSQWFRGKSFDTFAPLGPSIVTLDEIGDINNLRLICIVDGEIMQDGNTKDMIFNIESIVENISQDMTLLPGDVISTGTPSGVGIFRNPPIVLKSGNIVECRIEKIGSIINEVK
ncbi:MAG: fumarylacetoacetate hydrolase family protein [Desulfobacterales bacterium]|nr:fumarylacetoacetate hydrolase family protein [Desulfobacterales bacterium]